MAYAAAASFNEPEEKEGIRPLWLSLWIFGGLVALISLLAMALSAYLIAPEYTSDRSMRNIVISNSALQIPANFIRFEDQREASTLKRVDLYFLWPSGEGFSEDRRDEFTKSNLDWDLIFATLSEREMPFDMTGRMDEIYRDLFEGPSLGQTFGLTIQPLAKDSAYAGEYLYYEEGVQSPYVTRCVEGKAGVYQATCLRDIHIANGLTMSYRFPAKHLENWRQIEGMLTAKAAEFMQ